MSSSKAFRLAAGRGRVLLLAASLAAAAWAPRAAAEARQAEPDPAAAAAAREALRLAEERYGVKITAVRTSAAGHVVDVRYKVLDAGKASPLFERGVRPSLFDEASGLMLTVPSAPKTGPLRASGRPTEGRTYFILFSNPGGAVQCGSRVTLLLGDLEAPGLVVE